MAWKHLGLDILGEFSDLAESVCHQEKMATMMRGEREASQEAVRQHDIREEKRRARSRARELEGAGWATLPAATRAWCIRVREEYDAERAQARERNRRYRLAHPDQKDYKKAWRARQKAKGGRPRGSVRNDCASDVDVP